MFGTIIQAPMAGVSDHALAVAVAEAGGLGSIACGLLSRDQVQAEVAAFRARVARPVNLNFFCHAERDAPEQLAAWRARVAPYYAEYGLDPDAPRPPAPIRRPFDDAMCELVETLRPEVVSFHFGLPAQLERVRATGAKVIATATTVAEARWLAERGVDAVIAQGAEAGGHRGMFLDDDVATQLGTFALVPQICDAVRVPVIAAGGIVDERGVAAALALGATGVQVGSAYLRATEARTNALFRAALAQPTCITNVLTGRPARAVANRIVRALGPITDAPPYPTAAGPLAPLRAAAEARGSIDFSPIFAGQRAGAARACGAGDITRELMARLDRSRRS